MDLNEAKLQAKAQHQIGLKRNKCTTGMSFVDQGNICHSMWHVFCHLCMGLAAESQDGCWVNARKGVRGGLTSGVSLIFLGLEYCTHKGGSLLHMVAKQLHPVYTKPAAKNSLSACTSLAANLSQHITAKLIS